MRSTDINCGLPGNEKADELAKLGAKGRQHDNSVTFQEKKTLIRAALGQRTERDDFHFLDRWRQVVVMRLRTDHNRLNAHMFRKMKLTSSPTCNYGLEDQMAERILQICPLLQKARHNVWPTAVQQHTKLWQQGGTREEGHIHLADWSLSVLRRSKRSSSHQVSH